MSSSAVLGLLGWTGGRSRWGLEPCDFGLRNTHNCRSYQTYYYSLPEPVGEWGEKLPTVHDRLGIFCDLIMVGMITAVSKWIVGTSFKCVPRPEWNCNTSASNRMLYADIDAEADVDPFCWRWSTLGLSLVVQVLSSFCRNWKLEVDFKARFKTDDLTHRLLDMVGYFLLLVASNSITTAQQWKAHEWQARVTLTCVWLGGVLWWCRWLEVALLARQENARREAAAQLVDQALPLLLMLFVLMTHYWHWLPDTFIPLSLWTGAQAYQPLREFYRAARKALLPGPHWPKERISVPCHTGFMVSRQNELLMLMLGEVVLQLALADPPNSLAAHEWGFAWLSGFVLSGCLLYIVVLAQPHHDGAHHPINRHAFAVCAFNLSVFPMAFFLPLIGVALELALTEPLGNGCEQIRRAQRDLLANSLARCLYFQLLFYTLQWIPWPPSRGAMHGVLRMPRRMVFLYLARIFGYALIFPMGDIEMPLYLLVVALAMIAVVNSVLVHLQFHTRMALLFEGEAPAARAAASHVSHLSQLTSQRFVELQEEQCNNNALEQEAQVEPGARGGQEELGGGGEEAEGAAAGSPKDEDVEPKLTDSRA